MKSFFRIFSVILLVSTVTSKVFAVEVAAVDQCKLFVDVPDWKSPITVFNLLEQGHYAIVKDAGKADYKLMVDEFRSRNQVLLLLTVSDSTQNIIYAKNIITTDLESDIHEKKMELILDIPACDFLSFSSTNI